MAQPKRIITETFTYDDIIDVMMKDKDFYCPQIDRFK